MQIGRHEGRLIALAAALPVAVRLVLLAIDPVPRPYDTEDFNHLIRRTHTYSAGWQSRSSARGHVAVVSACRMAARPVRTPTSGGLFLYFGKVAFDSPFAGNLLAVSLTSAALYCMLLGWLPHRWAVIGTFIAIDTFCLFGYWVNSFWCPTTIVRIYPARAAAA